MFTTTTAAIKNHATLLWTITPRLLVDVYIFQQMETEKNTLQFTYLMA